MEKLKQIGNPLSRLEGVQKVTGSAKYSGEYNVPNLLQGYIVNSTITKGKIIEIDEKAARSLKGVIEIFSHKKRPKLAWFDIMYSDMDAPQGVPLKPLYNDEIFYNGQPIALVVAETFEIARYAASLIVVKYEEETFKTDLITNLDLARPPKKGLLQLIMPTPEIKRGDFDKSYSNSNSQYQGQFIHQEQHHNPLELFATTTVYEGDGKITVYDKTQGTNNCQVYIGNVFGLHYKDVRVISTYVGGGFGSGLRPQYQVFMSVMASIALKRNVRVTMDRAQMFTFGYRPKSVQNTKFATDKDGKVVALYHQALCETSQYEDYSENIVNWGNILYPAENTKTDYQLVPLDNSSPLDMRAPGGSTAMHAIESTIDQLSYQNNIDPLEFRILNYSERDVSTDKPFSSKELMQCYLQGADKFGWNDRNPAPRSTKRGKRLVGTGMSSGIWEVMTIPTRASAEIDAEGKLTVKSAVTDIGTGTLTVMTQIASDSMGVDIEDVNFIYGDSSLPLSPIQGGSYTTGILGSAVKAACNKLQKTLFKIAKKMDNSPFLSSKFQDVEFQGAEIFLKNDNSKKIAFVDIVAFNGGKNIKEKKFNSLNNSKKKKYTSAAHSAAFVEVEVDEELGVITVTRALTAVAAGKIINPKTAASQIKGGMIWGISKVLFEETLTDHNFGRHLNTNLGEYHIPTHADVHQLDVIFVEEKDEIINELGIKGVGEIGLCSMSPAIANAIYHATGKRMNNLPIHFNELI
ncbi:xanthine dehydrogenase family protein molybdopterin-binding subunit [Halpernia frigidisoli]|uniref:Xanthine dehydrogenase, molybdenum binding subunit apoprotein n=1 Tax=Halpernia frigidisoli TaxID=1125876 RepID=A0A1I3D6G8_9FLAO|nr:xanthine dehydrogenase family protein molybdopterin-binding subunit [Halpernia frigidisoli]SFH82323.1 xanthine dehydrogenase, molybdenum binding subunit apoprotein [Halpernia frigidisoli]